MNSTTIRRFFPFVGVLALCAVVLGAGCMQITANKPVEVVQVTPTTTAPMTNVTITPEFPGMENVTIPADWKVFKDESLGISFRYAPYMKLEIGKKNAPEDFELLLTRDPESACHETILFGFRTDTSAAFQGRQQPFGQIYSEDLEQLNPAPPNPVDTIDTHVVPFASWVQYTGEDYKQYSIFGDATLNCFRPYSEDGMAAVKDYKTVLKSFKIDIKK